MENINTKLIVEYEKEIAFLKNQNKMLIEKIKKLEGELEGREE